MPACASHADRRYDPHHLLTKPLTELHHPFLTCPPMPPPMGCNLPRYFVFKSVCLMQLNGRRGRRVGAKKAVSSLKPLFINPFKGFEAVLHAPIIRGVLRLTLTVDGCCHVDRDLCIRKRNLSSSKFRADTTFWVLVAGRPPYVMILSFLSILFMDKIP